MVSAKKKHIFFDVYHGLVMIYTIMNRLGSFTDLLQKKSNLILTNDDNEVQYNITSKLM